PHLLQLREFFFAELGAAQSVTAVIIMFEAAQLDAADFAGNRLRQFRHQFDLADALERREPRMQVLEDRQRGSRRTLHARYQQHTALLGDIAVAVGDLHAIARQRAAHGADFDLLARRVARERRGFGLAVAVADGKAPRRLHLIDHFGIERLARAADLAQAYLE